MNVNEFIKSNELLVSNPFADFKYKIFSADHFLKKSRFILFTGAKIQVPVSLTRDKYFLESAPLIGELYLQNILLTSGFGVSSTVSFQTNDLKTSLSFHNPSGVFLPQKSDRIMPVLCLNGIIKKVMVQNDASGFMQSNAVYRLISGVEVFYGHISVGSFYNFSFQKLSYAGNHFVSNKVVFWI